MTLGIRPNSLSLGSQAAIEGAKTQASPSFFSRSISVITTYPYVITFVTGCILGFLATMRSLTENWVKNAETTYLEAQKNCEHLRITPQTLKELQQSTEKKRVDDIAECEQKIVLEEQYRKKLGDKEEGVVVSNDLNQSYMRFVKIDRDDALQAFETLQNRRDRLYAKFEKVFEKTHKSYKEKNIPIPVLSKKSILIDYSDRKLKALQNRLTYLQTSEVIVTTDPDVELAQAAAQKDLQQKEQQFKRMLKLYNLYHWHPWAAK